MPSDIQSPIENKRVVQAVRHVDMIAHGIDDSVRTHVHLRRLMDTSGNLCALVEVDCKLRFPIVDKEVATGADPRIAKAMECIEKAAYEFEGAKRVVSNSRRVRNEHGDPYTLVEVFCKWSFPLDPIESSFSSYPTLVGSC